MKRFFALFLLATPAFGMCVHVIPDNVLAQVTTSGSVKWSGQVSCVGGAIISSPSSIPFGPVTIGTSSSSQAITVSNSTPNPATVGAYAITGPNGADFTAPTTCPGTLNAGANCNYGIVFTPSGTTTYTANATFGVMVGTVGISIPLSGTGVGVNANPTVSPSPGSFSSPPTLTITCSTPGAVPGYRTDGLPPSATVPGTWDHGTNTYVAPFPVNVTSTFEIGCTAVGYVNSSVVTFGPYTISQPVAATPTASPSSGAPPQTVTLTTTTGGAVIGYTTDGTTPTASGGTITHGTVYSGPISVTTSPTTILAIAAESGFTPSGVGSFTYSGSGSLITFTPPAGGATFPQSTAVATSVGGSPDIFTSQDTTTPSIAGPLYSGPITLNGPQTLGATVAVVGSVNQGVQTAIGTLPIPGWKCAVASPGKTFPGLPCASGGGIGSNLPSAASWTFGTTMNESVSTTATSGETQILYIFQGIACDSCTSIAMDKWVEPTGNANIANNEMDMYQFDTTRNIEHMFGLQCSQLSGGVGWEYDNVGGSGWKPMPNGATDGCAMANGTWVHVVYQGHWIIGDTGCGGKGCNYYDSLTITTCSAAPVNDTCPSGDVLSGPTVHLINQTLEAATTTFRGICGLQDQIDLRASPGGTITGGRNIMDENVSCGNSVAATGSATYTTATVATPTFTPASGTFNTGISVASATATGGASIFGSLDGSTPGSSSSITLDGFTFPVLSCTNTQTTTSALFTAINAATAGQTICAAAGTYNITATEFISSSGTSGNPITLYCPSRACILNGTGSGAMVEVFNSTPTARWLNFIGFNYDGNVSQDECFATNGGAHISIQWNVIYNCGGAGVLGANTDYVDYEHNIVFHNGYGSGFSSGLDLLDLKALDAYTGFHNFIAYNVVSGQFDGSSHHSDGNGIIVDDGGETQPTNDPYTLEIGNITYGNGGRGRACDTCSNVWDVNNTSYSNGLDQNQGSTNGEMQISAASNYNMVNDLFQSYNSHSTISYINSPTGITCHSVNYFGGSISGTGGCSSGTTSANPNYIAPTAVSSPAYTNGANNQYGITLPASTGLLHNLWVSSAVTGTNPLSLVSGNLATDMANYTGLDFDGIVRATTPSIGAYEFQSGTLLFSGPVPYLTQFPIKAIGVKAGSANSSQGTASFTITVP